jgi:hypothetical protein
MPLADWRRPSQEQRIDAVPATSASGWPRRPSGWPKEGSPSMKAAPSRTPGGNIDIPSHGAAVSALAIPPALVVLLRAPAMHMELAADPVSLVSEAGHGLLPQGGTILATDNALPARVVIGTTTQIDVRPSEPIREP